MKVQLVEPPDSLIGINPETPYTEVSSMVYTYCVDRDNALCILCGKAGGELHHVIYRSQGGRHKTNNLATLCKKHHIQVHNGELGKTIANVLLRKVKINDKKFRRRL